MAQDAVLFDLDGTVWDGDEWYASIAARGGDPAALLADIRSRRRPVATLLRQAGSRSGFARTAGEKIAALRLYHEVEETLAEIAEDGIPMAAVTNLPAWIARPMIDALRVSDYFPVLIDYTACRRRKPHPDPILLALERLGVPATRSAWYVGDSGDDCTAAKAAGISFAWASWGYGEEAPRGADAFLERFSEIASL